MTETGERLIVYGGGMNWGNCGPRTLAAVVFVWLLAVAIAAVGQAAFDVTTVKPSHATDGHHHIYNHAETGEFSASNVSLKELMEFAYELPQTRVVGGPAWMDSALWDVQGKAAAEMSARLHGMSFNVATAEMRPMVQALLVERFELKVHRETRELPVYALVVAKGGAKLGAVQASGTTIGAGRDHIDVQGGDSVEMLAGQLAKTLGRPVLNQTGLVGRYDLRVKWTAQDSADSTGPSIFTALEEQLGLRLETRKGPVEVLVLDRVGMPSEN